MNACPAGLSLRRTLNHFLYPTKVQASLVGRRGDHVARHLALMDTKVVGQEPERTSARNTEQHRDRHLGNSPSLR
jgi:hypothetical protein